MPVTSGQAVTVTFCTSDPSTGDAANADSLPTGTIKVSGVDSVAAVTVTNVGTGEYEAAFTLPTLLSTDRVELRLAATVGGVSGKTVYWSDTVAATASGTGSGDTLVDHDTGGTDAMRVVDPDGNGIAGVTVTAFVAADLTALGSAAEAEARTTTLSDGRWANPLSLDGGVEYTIRFTKFGDSQGEATVTP